MGKKRKTIVSFVLVFTLLLSNTQFVIADDGAEIISKVYGSMENIDQGDSVILLKGQSYTLPSPTYSTTSTAFSLTPQGKFKALSIGSGTFTMKLDDVEKTVRVSVLNKTKTSVDTEGATISVKKGTSLNLSKYFSYSVNSASDLNGTNLDAKKAKSLITVSKSKVTAKGTGKAVITSKGFISKDYSFSLENPKLSETKKTVNVGESAKLSVTGTTIPVSWYSDKSNIVSVDKDGNIKALAVGSAKVMAQINGKIYSATITSKAEKNKLSATEVYLLKGKSQNISISGISSSKLEWSSENTSIATVSKGKVIGVTTGSTIVTAKSSQGDFSAKVYVYDISAPAEVNVSVDGYSDLTINYGDEKNPIGVYPQAVWKAGSTKIATVSTEGVVHGLTKGKTTVNASVLGKNLSIKVNVIENATDSHTHQYVKDESTGIYFCEGCGEWTTNGDDPRIPKTMGILEASSMGIIETTDIEFYMYSDVQLYGIKLYKDGNEIGEMAEESSTNGFRYSTTTKVSTNPEGQVFIAKGNGYEDSNEIVIYSFDIPTEEDIVDTQESIKELEQITATYEENGYVLPGKYQDAINAAYEKAKELKTEGEILFIEKGEYGIEVQFDTGIWYAYEPAVEGTDASYVEGNISVFTSQPFLAGDKGYPSPDNDAVLIDESADYISFTKNVDDDSVTLDFLKTFGKNQIILWHGHGGYGDFIGPRILTGEEDNLGNVLKYASLCITGQLISCGGRLAFTSHYVDHQIGDMTGSVLFFASCHSAQDNRLANAFLHKGAELFIGFDDIVSRKYDLNAMEAFATQIKDKDSNGYFRNMNEIYNDTISSHGVGKEDPYWPTDAATRKEKGWGEKAAKIQACGNDYFTLNHLEMKSVTFDTNGGDASGVLLIARGDVLNESDCPNSKKEGYELEGWYLDEALTQKCAFPCIVKNDVTLYAKWVKKGPDPYDLGEMYMYAVPFDGDFIGFDEATKDYIQFREDPDDDMFLYGSINGIECLELNTYGMSELEYKNYIDGYTVCGIYPGQKANDAEQSMADRNFSFRGHGWDNNPNVFIYSKHEGYSYYEGQAYEKRYSVVYTTKNGFVTNVGIAYDIEGAG